MIRFSKAPYIELCRRPVDMVTLVYNVIDELNAEGAYSHTKVNLGYLGKSFCDMGLIKHVWANLISNAFKYSSKVGRPVVDISWYEDGEHNVYVVKDNGTGFNQIHAQRMFEAFTRLHSSDDFDGNGIGLAIVKKIVERHGGGVSAKVKLG